MGVSESDSENVGGSGVGVTEVDVASDDEGVGDTVRTNVSVCSGVSVRDGSAL